MKRTASLNPSPSRRWVATRLRSNAETGLRKTSVTRELPVGDAGHAPSAFARPLIEGVRTTLLFTMSNAGREAGEIRKQKSAAGIASNARSEFWLLISLWFCADARSVRACRPSPPFGLDAGLAKPKPRGGEGWWSQTGSNRRPPACKAGALPTELWPLLGISDP